MVKDGMETGRGECAHSLGAGARGPGGQGGPGQLGGGPSRWVLLLDSWQLLAVSGLVPWAWP